MVGELPFVEMSLFGMTQRRQIDSSFASFSKSLKY